MAVGIWAAPDAYAQDATCTRPTASKVTAVDDNVVNIDVDRRYTGGSADRATVRIPDAQTSVALDGVDFIDGRRYLLTATDGR